MQKQLLRFACTLLFCLTAWSADALTAGFTVSSVSGCSPLVVYFTNTSTGATTYAWDFGNGTTSGITNPSTTFISPGTFNVRLIAGNGSAFDTSFTTITVYDTPVVSFTASAYAVCLGSPITFTSTSTLGVAGAATYAWNFGDGGTGGGSPNTHTYTTSGNKNVTLTVTNSAGCHSSLTQTAFVNIFALPVATFSASTTSFCYAPATVAFSSTGSTGSGTLSYAWDFGDGGTATGAGPSHTYVASGTYSVRLIITDGNGCIDTFVRAGYITVGALASGFTYSSGCAGTAVAFTNTSTAATSYVWNFGDGGSATSASPSHTYAAGTYTVRLIATNGSCHDTTIHTLTVHPSPTCTFAITPADPCPATATITFTGTVPAGAAVTWDFGDGSTGAGTPVNHPYTSNGTFTVRMFVVDTNGCTDTVTNNKTIYDGTAYAWTYDYQICAGDPATLHFYIWSAVRGYYYPYGIAVFDWDFDDGTAHSAAANPTHVYAAVGVYHPSCTVTTANGCNFTAHTTVTVTSPPTVTYTMDAPTHICYGGSVTFHPVTTAGVSTEYRWNWGDGTTSTTTGATAHRFTRPGVFYVSLRGFNLGCPSVPFILDSVIVDSPQAIMSVAYNCLHPDSVKFKDLSLGDDTHTWLFPGGVTSSLDSLTYYFAVNHSYTVKLATYDSVSHCRDTASQTITVFDAHPAFTASDTTICNHTRVDFVPRNDTCGCVNLYSWSVNHTHIWDTTNPGTFSYTFHSAIIDTISLVIRDAHSCYDTLNHYVYVAHPTAHFSVSPEWGCGPLSDTITDHSTHQSYTTLTNYHFDFGDGSSASSGVSPVIHTYTNAGYYSITEIVTDNFGCMDTVTIDSAIRVFRPHAIIACTDTFPCIGSNTTFSYASSDSIASVVWLFGDGTTSTIASPSHAYGAVGSYSVRLVLTDSRGCRDTMFYPYHIQITRPHAAFTMSDTFYICSPFNDSFFNSSTGASTYQWSFGDGNTSPYANAVNTYITPGTYTVTLVAINSHGCTDTARARTTLYGSSGGFAYPLNACKLAPVVFTLGAASHVDSLTWDFGDGTTVTGGLGISIETYSYHIPGIYIPTLILYSHSGVPCRISSRGIDTVRVDSVGAVMVATPNPVCPYATITFIDSSTSFFSHITTHHWTFTTTATATTDTAYFSFGTPGAHPVTLISGDVWGCKDTVTDSIRVYAPMISVSRNDTICIGDTATLYASGDTVYLWRPVTGLPCSTCDTIHVHPTATTTYTVTGVNTHGCRDTATVTVTVKQLRIVGPITGVDSVCVGSTTTFYDTSTGGTWRSFDTTIATVNSSGVITGVRAGIDTIYYAISNDCGSTTATRVVRVNPIPTIIQNTSGICIGDTITVTDSISGGKWISSNPTIATIDSVTGKIHGLSGGTVTITYLLPTGCYRTASFSVFALPTLAGISGPDSVCVGNSITLIDTPSGGTWSCTNAHATIATTGVLTGASNGIDTVYYSFTGAHGCSVRDRYIVRIYAFPTVDSFYFKDTICTYDSTMLYFPSTLVWTNFVSSNPAIARIDSSGTYYYIVGLSPGLDTISYTINNHGCITTRMDIIRIMPPPHLGPIGPDTVCVGSTILLHDSTGMGAGTWSAHDSAYLVIDTVTGALITGIGVGTAIVTFTSSPNGYECWNYVYDTIHVLAPPVIPAITGIDSLCLGSPAVFLFDSLTGGRWTSSTTGVATIDSLTGEVTGIDTGRTIITYTTIDRLGCISRVTDTFRVDSLPYVHLIVMKDSVCPHDSVMLDTSLHGGWWSSSDAGIALIDSATGFVIGVSPGTVTLTYTVVNAFGCVGIATIPFTVLTPPFAGAITGPDTLCIGLTSIYTSSSGTSAAYWATSDTLVARVDTGAAFGTIVGVGAGTAIISFILTSNAGCTSSATKIVTVIPVIISPIIGPSSLCVGTTFTYTNPITGGMWSSPDLNISVNPVTGDVTGLSAGPATISYTYTTVCGPTTVTLPITVDPMPEPIVGVIALCSPDSALFTDAVPGGSWSTSNAAIASVDPVTGWVYGIASGTAYITYTLVNACGTNDVVTAVTINMLPYIVTNFVVACQTLAVDTTGRGPTQGSGGYNGNGHNYVLTDSSGCIMVCDSTVVRYYGRGVLGSHFTWGISGGSILAYYGANNDSVDVIWPTAGVTGYIEVFDTFSHCIGDYRVCIKVISRPHALFTSSAVSICRDEQVCFNDLSTGDATSPIVYWHWDFGDGTGSTVHSPCHTFTAPGIYMVTLTVKNRCNCTSTYQIPIEVHFEEGIHIDCAGAACENETATYTLPGGSPATVWSVIGGHMIPTMPANTIRVKWDAVGADGYGYVSAYDPLSSALCRDTTTIRVPIILDSATIQGPSTACVGQQYEYSLPLWGSTDYRWGVLGKPGLIVGYNDDFKMAVIFDTPGVYMLHAKYQNRIKLCGGDVYKTVTVLPPVKVQGPTIFCQYTTQTWFISASTARWELVDPTGHIIDVIASASTYTYTFPTAGIYTLIPTGAFCTDPVSLTVMAAPPPVDSVKGPDTVCRGRVYTYTAYADMPGTTYHWTATGGTVTPADGSPTVNVTWTGSGAKSLSVSRQSVFEPYCDGTPTVITIIDEPITPNISGNASPCANSLQGYNGNYYKGDTYEWSIFPDSCGSVVGGNHGMNANILWNNVVSSPTAAIVLKVQKCDSVVTDTFYAVVQPSPAMTISPSLSPACSKVPVTFTAAAGDSAYVWNFGDGSPLVTTTTNTVIHVFPPNYTSSNAGYTVVVTAILGVSTGCPPIGSATYNMTILPGPLAFNSTASPYNPCPMTANVTYVGTVTSNVGTITYQWFDPSFVSGATGSTYSSTADGAFYFIATGANGCADTSNYVIVNHRDCPSGSGTGSSGSGSGGGSTGTGATTGCLTGLAMHTCTDMTVVGSPAGGQWFLVNPSSYPYAFTAGMDTVNMGFPAPGIYVFMYVNGTSCPHDTIYVADTIPIVPDFRYSIVCGPGNTDTLILYDHSTYLPWISITGESFSGTAYGAAGTIVRIPEPAPFRDTIIQTLWYTGGHYCQTIKYIDIPAKPHVWFTDTLTPICEGVPIAFTPYSSGSILSCLWEFGDLSSSLLSYTKRTYSWVPSFNPATFFAKLTVTDSVGCVADSIENISIFQNDLTGRMDLSLVTLCKGDFPFAVNFTHPSGTPTPISYIWSTGDTTAGPTLNVDSAGAYWVTVYNAHQCQFTTRFAENISMVKVPEARIFGRHRYCVGDDVQLSGYAGSSTGYQWILHDTTTVGTDPTLTIHGLGAGVHHIQLITSATENGVTCYDTSDLDSFFVYGLPAPPVITGPTVIDCGMYHLQLTATSTAPGDFNWQDGTFTSSSFSSVDDIYSGGPYKVWFTDVNGCISHADTIVPLSPDYYFQYLMQGCYTLCGGQLPITLNGPPHVKFSYWEWLMGGGMIINGSNSVMAPYTLIQPNDYSWTLDNGLCSATSGILHIDTTDCNSCEQTTFSCVFTCDATHPARYTGTLTMTNYLLNRAFTIGTDGGPVTPFTGGLPMGPVMLHFNFTVIDTNATSVTFTFIITDTLTGAKCYQKVIVALPDCHWIREKTVPGTDNGEGKLADALLVYPNPASQEVNISYDYGSRPYGQRNLSIYDALGRKVGNLDAPDSHGTWHVDTKDFVPGMYVIRMEGDGKTLQMQKLVVSN